jgi:hypothetical protein
VSPSETDADAIESYLDRLLLVLPGTARQVRHTLAEVEAHLRDAAAAAIEDGHDEPGAQRLAVEQLGPVNGVVDARSVRWRLTPARRRRMVLATLLIAGVAGLAVAAAGGLAVLVRALGGDRAIATPFPTGSYTAADCARWMHLYPTATNCVSAMTADHADDFVRNCVAAGLLGMLAVVTRVVLRGRWSNREVRNAFPRGAEEIVGAIAAALVALVMLGRGADALLVTHGNGAGQSFVLAASAAAATTFLAISARSRARHARWIADS